VRDTPRSLRHLAFFEELALLDEVSSTWREISAGLVVLRLVDAWIEDGPHVVAREAWGLSGVRAAIDEIPHGRPVRGILRSVVDIMESSDAVDVHALTPRLLAYGRALDFDGKLRVAVDVYRTIAAHADPVDDGESAIAAHLRLGYCLRQLGDLAASAEAYRTAGQLAASAHDMMGVLRARIGDAKIAILRGNIPLAEAILDETIDDASRHGFATVKSMALHDRSYAAGVRGEYELAIQLAYRALECPETDRERDRILYDIATSFYNLGVRSAAQDAYLVLAATGQDYYMRWACGIQLLAIAADDRMGPAFERYRRELADSDLPPVLAVEFAHQTGRGYRLFGDRNAASEWLARALNTAREFRFNQEVFRIEAEFERLARDEQEERRFERYQSPREIVAIADSLREMREKMVVGS